MQLVKIKHDETDWHSFDAYPKSENHIFLFQVRLRIISSLSLLEWTNQYITTSIAKSIYGKFGALLYEVWAAILFERVI